MSHTGSIAKLNKDQSVTAIYVSFDSHVMGVGQILINHYQDDVKIDQLLALGDLCRLAPEIGARRTRDRDPRYPFWCTAYGRDRGETDCDARHYENVKMWLYDGSQEYNYLWHDSEWLVSGWGTNHKFRSVIQMLLEIA
jgi:hypothetical protein